jgi:hypothetical protein
MPRRYLGTAFVLAVLLGLLAWPSGPWSKCGPRSKGAWASRSRTAQARKRRRSNLARLGARGTEVERPEALLLGQPVGLHHSLPRAATMLAAHKRLHKFLGVSSPPPSATEVLIASMSSSDMLSAHGAHEPLREVSVVRRVSQRSSFVRQVILFPLGSYCAPFHK